MKKILLTMYGNGLKLSFINIFFCQAITAILIDWWSAKLILGYPIYFWKKVLFNENLCLNIFYSNFLYVKLCIQGEKYRISMFWLFLAATVIHYHIVIFYMMKWYNLKLLPFIKINKVVWYWPNKVKFT